MNGEGVMEKEGEGGVEEGEGEVRKGEGVRETEAWRGRGEGGREM